ncbi:hypothetical protein [Blastococcus tunisiensis]|uniref:N-acetyltransferase domain-containing protein n=1 Tax=Blastococcus tunisiensis TaxID=1798228 RepID=A0A1I2MUL3_9ACTN|nr:hypothetical protein [Blastococcus sp. DSM 46838]SFF95103.1 hypothetical protein SAMN05216574_1364 [Blastococcus sp. DSM 46838]
MAGPSFLCTPLNEGHQLVHFSCGHVDYDEWLKAKARDAHEARISRVFVLAPPDEPRHVVAYFTLSNNTVYKSDIPNRFAKGVGGASQMPGILLGRLARDESARGILPHIMLAAFERAVQASDLSAARFLVIDAADERLATMYEAYGFTRAKVKEERSTIPLIRFIKDIVAEMKAAETPA